MAVMMAGEDTAQPARFYPRLPETAEPLVVGQVRYTRRGGQRVIILAESGWSDSGGYGPIPIGVDAAVAADCGWIWEPRVYVAFELLSARESIEYRRALARHHRCMADERRKDAESEDRRAIRLDAEADVLTDNPTGSGYVPLRPKSP